jgi:hypothetical protein
MIENESVLKINTFVNARCFVLAIPWWIMQKIL